jgi:hypothetical protein
MAIDLTAWHDFFVASVSSAAALTGLIFVGVSINITRILSFPKLPDRALLSIILLLNIFVISALMLIPRQSYLLVGTEVSIIAVGTYGFVTKMDIGIYKNTDSVYKKQYLVSMVYNQLSLLPYIAAGVAIFIWKGNGIYWLIPGIIISFIKAVADAWVLLVEINR